MKKLLQDVRYAARTFVKRPGFIVINVLTLALGIGASTAIFTVVNAALIKGLPYRSPEALYHLFEITPQQQFNQREFSYPDYQDYQQNQICDIAAYTGGGAILSGRGDSEQVFAPSASGNFFSVLGVEPVLGRTFQPEEAKPGGPKVTVLTYATWQKRFGADPTVVGQAVNLNGENYTVIGVLPSTFQFAFRQADFWRPYQPTEAQLTRRFLHGTNLIARLKPGVTMAQAQSELGVIAGRIQQQYADSHAGTKLKIVPLQEQIVGGVKPVLFVLLAAVGFVLLIACANVAGLLLTRSLARQKEVAIRAALGASRWRIIRQLLTESVLLSLAGGLLGLLLAYWGIGALVSLVPDGQINSLPFLKTLRIDTGILTFSFLLSLVTGLVFGLAPAVQASRLALNEVLKEGGRNSAGGAGNKLRSAFVITEIALAVVLLVGAGLMLKSLMRLLQTSPGFNPENVLTMTVVLPRTKYTEDNRQIQFMDQLKERVQAIPGVTAVGMVNILPLQGGNTTRVNVEGDPIPPAGQEIEANIRDVNETYFQTLGVPILAGRMFDERDKAGNPSVVIIGKTMADKIFGSRDPIGRRLVYSGINAPPEQIVGVVGDLRITGLDEAPKPIIYYPYRQDPSPATNLVVRTTAEPNAMVATIREQVRALEPEVALFNSRAMDQLISDSPAAAMRRFPAVLTSVFGALALLLSSIGIYGVVSYSVSQQTRHIGVRMALGAQTSDILKMVLKQGVLLALVGVAVGALAALGLMRLLRSLLFEVQTYDVVTFVVAGVVLFAVALLACYLPARRATKVDPLEALRYE